MLLYHKNKSLFNILVEKIKSIIQKMFLLENKLG